MVINISKTRLVMIFVEGLLEPLRGWVKAYKPTYLHDTINKACDM
jgi:hypothetical protein